jgi:hypothetical protein
VRLRRVGVTVSAVLLSAVLAGCSGLRPGEAIVVGDQTISDDQVEQTSHDLCTFLSAYQVSQGAPADQGVPARAVALTAMQFLLRQEAAEQLAADEGVEVSSAEMKEYVAQLPVPAESVPPDQRDEIKSAKELIARTQLLTNALGEPGSGNLTESGQKRINQYLDEVGYQVERRHGQVLDAQSKPGTGSLSIAVSDEGVRGMDLPQGGNSTEAELCS